MARLRWNRSLPGWGEDDGERPCPECRGRADDGCLTCGGEGFV